MNPFGFVYDLSKVAEMPSPRPSDVDPIDPDTYAWPDKNQGGETNNIPQIAARVIRAWRLYLLQRLAEARIEARNAAHWLDYYLEDADEKDDGHTFLDGGRLLVALLRQFGREHHRLIKKVNMLLDLRGRVSLYNLARYCGLIPGYSTFLEPRLLGGALSNSAAYLCHLMDENLPIPELTGTTLGTINPVILFDKAVQLVHPSVYKCKDVRSESSYGWFTAETPDGLGHVEAVVMSGREVKGIRQGLVWQIGSRLPYGMIESWPFLSTKARISLQQTLSYLRAFITTWSSGLTEFGGSNPQVIINDLTRSTFRLVALQPEKESAPEASYSFEIWRRKGLTTRDGSVVSSVAAFAPSCLPVKSAIATALALY